MRVPDVRGRVEHVDVGGRDVHVAADHRVLGTACDHLSQRGQPGELVAVVIGVGLTAVGHVHAVHADTATRGGDRARLGIWEAGRAVDPDDDFVEANAREDRDPVPLRLAVTGERIAATGELRAEQLVERVVGELGLLQADDIRLALLEPRQQPRHPLLDGVHVPRRHPHGRTVAPPRSARRPLRRDSLG